MKGLITTGVLILSMVISAGVMAGDEDEIKFSEVTFYEVAINGALDTKITFHGDPFDKLICTLPSAKEALLLLSFVKRAKASNEGGRFKKAPGKCAFSGAL